MEERERATKWRKFLFDASGATRGRTKEAILQYLKE
jgi:hypothetical protein